jgi:hypothetical protein
MPGGQLSFFFYQQLGGERGFGDFWCYLGLPVVFVLVIAYYQLAWKTWQLFAPGLVGVMIAGVGLRAIT